MTFFTVALYLAVFTVWAFSIRREGGIGVGFRFLFGVNLTLFYLMGPIVSEVFGENIPKQTDAPLEPAIQMALYGLSSYLIAAYWAFPAVIRKRTSASQLADLLKTPGWADRQYVLGWSLFALGASSLALNSFFFAIPTIRAVWSTVNALAETGLFLVCISALRSRTYKRFFAALLVLSAYSLFYSANGGHIGGQFIKGMFFLCVAFLALRFGLYRMVVLLLFGLMAFIPYQQWLTGRQQLRNAIAEQVPFQDRLAITIEIFADPMAPLTSQSTFAGTYVARGDYSELLAAAIQHTPAEVPFANGETLLDIFVAMIPRALWPDKPLELGGNSFVTKYTGMRFGEDTSVAATFLFEFYVNFGLEGVIGIMFLLGLTIAWMEYMFYRWSGRHHWGAVALIGCMWALALEATTMGMAMMLVAPAVVVAWASSYITRHFTGRARPIMALSLKSPRKEKPFAQIP